jgi:hypothetical protein
VNQLNVPIYEQDYWIFIDQQAGDIIPDISYSTQTAPIPSSQALNDQHSKLTRNQDQPPIKGQYQTGASARPHAILQPVERGEPFIRVLRVPTVCDWVSVKRVNEQRIKDEMARS